MADGWEVDTNAQAGMQAPSAPPATPAPGAGGGWDVDTSATPPSSPTGQPTEDHVDDWLQKHYIIGAPLNLLSGIGAGVEETGAGLAKLAHKVTGGAIPEGQWLQREAAKPTTGAMQTAGKTVENLGEFFTGEELLGMLGRTGTVMNAAEKLKSAQQIAGVLAKHPYLAKMLKVGMETVKSGVMGGAQEYAKTGGDTSAAAQTGLLTGAGTAVMGGAGVAGKALLDLAPGVKELEGVAMPYLKSQINKAGKFVEGGDVSELAPEIAAQQQAGAKQIVSNMASRATQKVLDSVNATRKFFSTPEEAAEAAASSNLLPAGEGGKGFTFDLGMRPVTEEGEAATEGFAKQGLKSPEEHAALEKTREAAADETITELGTKKALNKRLTPEEKAQLSEAQGQYAEPTTQLEPHQTTDPAEAINHLSDMKDFRNGPEYSKLSDAERATFDQQYKTLSDQLDVYHSSPYRNNFAPIDTNSVAGRVNTFGNAADQIKAAVRPVLQKADQISRGRISALEQGVHDAQNAVRSATSDEAFADATKKLAKASQAFLDGVDNYRGGLTRMEHQTAMKAVGEANQMGTLHAVFEHMMNGVTHEESEQGLSRVMTGNARRLQGWLDNPNNTAMVDRLLGKDTRLNMKELTLLMSKVTPQRHMAEGVKNIARLIDPAKYRTAGAVIGGAAGSLLGAGATKGAAAGVASAEAMRFVIRQAATNPTIGKTLTYAVSHGIRPDVYAPLIGRMIAEPSRAEGQLWEPGEQGTEQPGATQ